MGTTALYFLKSGGRVGTVRRMLKTKPNILKATAKRETYGKKAVVRDNKTGRFQKQTMEKGDVIDLTNSSPNSFIIQMSNPLVNTVDVELERGTTTYRFPFNEEDRNTILSSPSPSKAIWAIYGDYNWR